MLSIVKMDLDSDVEILEEEPMKSEKIEIDVESDADCNILHDLELVPVVYTTKLDDMRVLKLSPDRIHPSEASERIFKESKPVLWRNPGPPKKSRKNTRRFEKVKTILEKIYRPTDKQIKKEETENLNCLSQIKINSIKSEVLDEPIVEFVDNTNSNSLHSITKQTFDLNSVKSEVLDESNVVNTDSKDTCKYSDLLKLCKPCSVILTEPVLIGPYWCSRVIHGGRVLQANRVPVQKPRLHHSSQSRSSDDDASNVSSQPNLLVEHKKANDANETEVKKYKGPKPKCKTNEHLKVIELNDYDQNATNTISSHLGQRVMRNNLLEMHDKYSNEYHVYFADSECNLLEYIKKTEDNDLYESLSQRADCRYKIENCCWVKKDEFIQSLYPKVLIYPNARFMRKPHPCKPGACVCCCRKKENNVVKPLFFYSNQYGLPSSLSSQTSLENEVIEILDLEDKIDKTVISVNKIPTPEPNAKLRSLLTEPPSAPTSFANTLIRRALIYKKSLIVKHVNNRRLVTLKKAESQNTAIILWNFEANVTEIYEINVDRDVESHLKTTCFTNTSQSDVKKLLRLPITVHESVCCWFKREEVIKKLHTSKTLSPSAVKFIRTRHKCQSNECTCCCKPEKKKELKLKSIMLPMRSQHWISTLRAWKLTSEEELSQEQPRQPVPSKPIQKKPSARVSSVSKKKDIIDDDCQITSVITSPTLQPLPQKRTVPAATVPPSIFVPNVVNSDDLSQEVNSLITSILDRFKDVRLTINSEGKVAAALNTPVSTLSTVELKVLANILSYAQSQVNLLGEKVNSGMSLSSIINLKVDDVQANTPIDPNSVYKEFGKNVTVPIAQQVPVPPQSTTVPNTYTFFTNSMTQKNQHFNDAFSLFINTKMDPNPVTTIPVIENVFSLKDAESENTVESLDEDSSFTTVWYRKPNASSSVATASELSTENESKKRNDNSNKEDVKSKKIKVLSPTKLSTDKDESVSIATAVHIPIQLPAPVHGQIPGLVFVPNNNFNLSQPRMQSMVNCVPSVPVSQPILIINPLHNAGGLLSTANNTSSMANVVHNQPKMPIIVNSGSIAAPEFVSTPVDTTMAEEGSETVDSVMDNGAEIEDNTEMDDDTATDDYAYDEEDVEIKYSPENLEEEDDCILGF